MSKLESLKTYVAEEVKSYIDDTESVDRADDLLFSVIIAICSIIALAGLISWLSLVF